MSLSSPLSRTQNHPSSRSRSRSPTIVKAKFSSTPPPSGDVQNITRKVIRRLEGLGHLEMVDAYAVSPEDRDNDTDDVPSSNVSEPEDSAAEVELVLVENHGLDTRKNGHVVHENGQTNGSLHANGVEKKQKQKVDWEIPRKLLHSSIGFFTLYLYITESSVAEIVLVLWSSLCIIVPADILRLRSPAFERLYERVLGFLMRESEKHSTNGVIWYILGVNFALQFYPRDVATIAILILSWADTAASTIGRLYGPSSPRLPSHFCIPHPKLPLVKIPLAPRKSYAGFIAASLTGAMIAVGFWAWIAPMRFEGREVSWDFVRGVTLGGGGEKGVLSGWVGLGIIGVVAGLVSGVAEAMDLGSLDDNLTLPIISGGCILGFLSLAGWISSSFWTSVAS
ncbi:hypothetical protein D9756_011063 [Leucocoprinus leucothites]|uniref:CTP-dependent diacylglycerol kinase 1 n=1 Tax=Leucocoprinus leucothites TaxID=201217 RepID=A0A8H5CQE6_9AGAR|nr:hypothetical protein D9756_011063 [Leucoagaricus leucothites]